MNDFLRRIKLGSRKSAAKAEMNTDAQLSAVKKSPHAIAAIFDQYEAKAPTQQNAVDLLPGWNTCLPVECGVQAGTLQLQHDPRLVWAQQQFGPLDGARILELGPLEASHTVFLEQMGGSVLGIEANKIAYLKCLVVKEVVPLQRARFMLGDFMQWLDERDERYDLIVASGVLYHLSDPLRLLTLIARRSRAAYIWTHYVSEEAMPISDPRRNIMTRPPEIVEFHGQPMRLYPRTYNNAQKDVAFTGGMADHHKWMHRDDILTALRLLGFDEIAVAHDAPNHPNGPSISIFARMTGEA